MSAMSGRIEIYVNGEPLEVPVGSTIADLLDIMAVTGDRVAVELDRNIVKRQSWPQAALQQGARVEIVHFVGGG